MSKSRQITLWDGVGTQHYEQGIQYNGHEQQVTRAGTSNYIPQYLWDVITCPCPWYLLLAQHSWCVGTTKHVPRCVQQLYRFWFWSLIGRWGSPCQTALLVRSNTPMWGGRGARYGFEVGGHLEEVIVSASAVSGGNEFHFGMVRTMVDLHNGECWSLPDSLCSFLLCEVVVSRAGDLRSNSSGDILKWPFRSLYS